MVRTGPGPTSFRAILHAVAIDGFYGSSVELVTRTISLALREADALGARSVALPALATGYGPLSVDQFAQALAVALDAPWEQLEDLHVVLSRAPQARTVRARLEAALAKSPGRFTLGDG